MEAPAPKKKIVQKLGVTIKPSWVAVAPPSLGSDGSYETSETPAVLQPGCGEHQDAKARLVTEVPRILRNSVGNAQKPESTVYGMQYLVYDMLYGTWYIGYSIQCMVYGTWYQA